jgi:radical SAM-linked protein
LHLTERLLRRARIPFATTQGFHPQPKITFALSLALGIAALDEIVELELTRSFPDDDLLRRLNEAAPEGLVFTSCRSIVGKSSMQVRRAFYRLEWPEARPDVPERVARFLERREYWVRRARPLPRRVNLLPLLSALHASEQHLEMILWITPTGAARPQEILRALDLDSMVEAGAVLQRTKLELFDEVSEAERPLPDFGVFALPIDPRERTESEADDVEREESSRHTPLLANPLSFET